MNSPLAPVLRTPQDLIRCAQPRRMFRDRCRSWCNQLHPWRTCWDHWRSWHEVFHHGAGAAQQTGVMNATNAGEYSTTGAGAAVAPSCCHSNGTRSGPFGDIHRGRCSKRHGKHICPARLHADQQVPSTKNQLMPRFKPSSLTLASCSSPATRAQSPSNH